MNAASFENEMIRTGLGQDIKLVNVTSLEEAVIEANKMAEKGDTILLSPASSSYDMFPNFEVKGRLYKDLVRSL